MEPNDGQIINTPRYKQLIPDEISPKIKKYGSIGLYYSIPSEDFSNIVDFLMKKASIDGDTFDPSSKLRINCYKGYISKVNLYELPRHVYTAEFVYNNIWSFISIIKHENNDGSVIIISSDAETSIRLKMIIAEMVTIAIKYWRENKTGV